MAEERMRDDTCPTCGGPVVVQGDGLTHWYRPAPTDQGERDGLACVEPERLEEWADYLGAEAHPTTTDLLTDAADEIRHLRTSTEGPTRADRDDIVRLTEIRNDWQRKPSRYRDDANLLTRILAALTREAESVRAEATLAAIRAHAGTIWDAHDCKTAAVTYFDGEDAGRNHALTRDESSTEGGARLCRHDSTRVDGWLDDHCLRCGSAGYFKDGRYVDPTGKPSKGHPSGKTLIWPAQSEGAGEARVNVDDLAQLEDGWDGYGKGRKITDAALATARHTQVVPMADGGLQMEWHIAGIDCEIEIQPNGKITSFYVEPASAPDTPTEEEGTR